MGRVADFGICLGVAGCLTVHARLSRLRRNVHRVALRTEEIECSAVYI